MGVQGAARLRVNDQVYMTSPGFAILLHPDDEVEGDETEETHFCNMGLHFNPMFTEGMDFDLSTYRMQPVVLRHFAAVREIANYMADLMEAEGRHRVELDDLAGQILRIFMHDHAMGQRNPVDTLIRKQAEQMRHHPEQIWTVEQMAQDAELSTSQFTRRFSEMFKLSPNAYLIRQRLDRAQELLLETRMSINEISEALGYRDVAFFSRQFKSHIGLSPMAMRKRIQQISG